MKTLYLTHTLNNRTGIGEFASNVINGVRKMSGITPEVLTSEDFLSVNFFKLIMNWPKIRQKIREADLIHALDTYPYGVMAVLAKLFIKKPLIITAIGSGSLQNLQGKGIRTLLLRYAYRKATIVTAISRYVAEEINKVLPEVSVEVINPGVDYRYWGRSENSEITSMLHKFQPYLLTVGEIKKRKGYSVLLPILEKIIKNGSEVQYVIVGNRDRNQKYWNELDVLIRNLGIEREVSVLSNISREDLRTVYQNASLYVLLPQNINGDVEGFGLSVIEAAAAGVPAVVGKGSGAEDAVLHGQSGFLVSSENPEEVRSRIEEIIQNPELRRKLSQGALQFAEKMTWENKIKRYIEVYEKIQS